MTDQPQLAKLERVEHGVQLAPMVRAVGETWFGGLRMKPCITTKAGIAPESSLT